MNFPEPSLDVQKKQLPEHTNFQVPVSIFHDRSLSVLEAISEYMKDSVDLTYHEIAKILNRDDRTIWTCYHRAKIKRTKHAMHTQRNPNRGTV